MGADGSGKNFLKISAGGSRLPASISTIEQNLHYIYMDGSEVFKFAVRIMADAAKEAIIRANIEKEDIDFLIPHQANKRIIEGAAKRLELNMSKIITNLDRYGNMSAASIPVALDEVLAKGMIKRVI